MRRFAHFPEENNFVTALEDYLRRNDLEDIFRRARSGNARARSLLMTIDERTREVLPEGRRVQDKYRAYIERCVQEARTCKSKRGRKA